MPAKRKTYEENIPEGFKLADILQDAGSSIGIVYSAVNGTTIRRLLHCVGELGGMASFYIDHSNQRFCVSLRIGSEKRSYAAETAELFEQQLEAFIGKITPALVKAKKVPPPKPE